MTIEPGTHAPCRYQRYNADPQQMADFLAELQEETGRMLAPAEHSGCVRQCRLAGGERAFHTGSPAGNTLLPGATGVRSPAFAEHITRICTVAGQSELDCTAVHNGESGAQETGSHAR